MRVLVAVASRHGSTAEIASEISKNLRRYGDGVTIRVDNRAVDDIDSLDGYDAIIIGSAIYGGHWLAPAVEFATRHEEELRRRPLWLFSSGPLGEPDSRAQAPTSDVVSITRATDAIEHRMFGGRIDRGELGPAEQAVVRTMGFLDGDFRDWAAVRAWVERVVDQLEQTSGPLRPDERVEKDALADDGRRCNGRRRSDCPPAASELVRDARRSLPPPTGEMSFSLARSAQQPTP